MLTRIFHRDLVDEVLRETRSTELRSRLLPARVVVYYVLALCLFCDDAYEEVMRKLVNGLRFIGTWADGWQVPTTSAISQARTRLGEAPLAVLFDRVAVPIGGSALVLVYDRAAFGRAEGDTQKEAAVLTGSTCR